MFEQLLNRFKSHQPDHPHLPEPDAQLALSALLVRVAMADNAYLFEEVEAIDSVLCHAFDLKPLEAAKLRAQGERFHRQLPEDMNLAAIVRDAVDAAHRLQAAAGLWQVMVADGVRDERELRIATLVDDYLGIPHDLARKTAQTQAQA